jgi:hypothetical protein
VDWFVHCRAAIHGRSQLGGQGFQAQKNGLSANNVNFVFVPSFSLNPLFLLIFYTIYYIACLISSAQGWIKGCFSSRIYGFLLIIVSVRVHDLPPFSLGCIQPVLTTDFKE